MATTIGQIATWACGKVDRPDKMGKACEEAVALVRLITGKIPFDSLCVKTAELPVVAGTREYSLASLDPELEGIMSIRFSYSTTSSIRLRKTNGRALDAKPRGAPNGRTYQYARFGGALEFDPTPNSSSYTYRIRYWKKHDISEDGTPIYSDTELLTPPAWDELFKWELLYRMYYELDRPQDAMLLMAPTAMPRQYEKKKTYVQEIGIIPRLWNELLLTVDRREAIDDDFGMSPIIRRYS